MTEYFHLAGTLISNGSIIDPGNYGRIIRMHGWAHTQALREMAIETARLARFPEMPSRLDCCFAFLTAAEARFYQGTVAGFGYHILYRVSLAQKNAKVHIANYKGLIPIGQLNGTWPDSYWKPDPDANWQLAASADPPIIEQMAMRGELTREMLTLSPLVVQERLD